MPSPLYSRMAADWHLAPFALTIAYAVYAAAAIMSLLVVGSVADSVGRKPVLVTAMIGLLIGLLLLTVVTTYPALIVARVIHGAAVGATIVAAGAALYDLRPVEGERSGRLISVALGIGLGLGALVSGFLADVAPMPLVTPFATIGVAVLGLTILALQIPEPFAGRGGRVRITRPRIPEGIVEDFIFSVTSAAVAWGTLGFYLSLGPGLAEQEAHLPYAVFGGAVVAILCLAGALVQATTHRIHARRLVITGNLIMAVAVLLSVPIIRSGDAILILLIGACLGAGYGATFSGSLRYLGSVMPEAARGTTIAAFYLCCYSSLAIPVVIAGWAATRWRLSSIYLVYAIAVASICLLGAFLGRSKHHSDSASAVQRYQ